MIQRASDCHGRSSVGTALALVLILLLVIFVVGWMTQYRDVPVGDVVREVSHETDDAATTAKVKTAFALSKRVEALDIDVDTEGGTVTLSGIVRSEADKAEAGSIAADTVGVVRVDNRLAVRPEHAMETDALPPGAEEDVAPEWEPESEARGALQEETSEDLSEQDESLELPAAGETRMAQRVEQALSRTDAIETRSIVVEARGGTIHLTGRVRSRAEKLLAERLALEVEGVRDVVNELEVAAL